MLAVQIRFLIELGVTAGESPKLRVVIPATNFEKTGITIVSVNRGCSNLVTARGAARFSTGTASE